MSMPKRRSSRHRICWRGLARALLIFTVLTSAATAQPFSVSYGDHTSGTIAAVGQIHNILLFGAQPGDTLRTTFYSRYAGGGYYVHKLDIRDGSGNTLGTITGRGVIDIVVPTPANLTISVRARNNQDTGDYAFQIDRLNDPVDADRIAFGWNMRSPNPPAAGFRSDITSNAEFAVYTLRAEAGKSARISFTSRYAGGGYYVHYAELVDQMGVQLARVDGNGTSSVFTFPASPPASAVYTLFVAARNYADAGHYSVTVECLSTPCDCSGAYGGNYGQPYPTGSSNVVPSLTAGALPQLGGTASIVVGNPFNQPALALVLTNLSADNTPLALFGDARLLVSQPGVLATVTVPASGQTTLNYPIPNFQPFCGISIALQSVVAPSSGTPPNWGAVFSRGLLMLIAP